MTLEEKIHLLVGTSMDGKDDDGSRLIIGKTKLLVPGAAGTTYPIERLGIPAIVLADGPAGVRIAPIRDTDSATYYCTGFPIGSLLASTWDTPLLEQVGAAIGDEAREYGVDILLAPGMNIMRNPLCGRNFEYYSEDPLLSGRTAAAVVRGVESKDVAATIKHFVANNQEINRLCNDARIDARTLREIYLRGFEIAVQEAHPRALMTSYNYLNGRYTSEDRALLTDILREDWGFSGTVITDWSAGQDVVSQVAAGNDMIQPGSNDRYEALLTAAREGRLSMDAVDQSVRRILELIVRSPRFKGYIYSNRPNLQQHATLSRQAATEGMVLLENHCDALPLDTTKRIALFGVSSYRLISGGTGAGDVNKAYTVELCEGLRNAGYPLDEVVYESYVQHLAHEDERLDSINQARGWWFGAVQPNELSTPELLAQQAVNRADAAIITIGRRSGEGTDRHIDDDFLLRATERHLLTTVQQAFHAAHKPVIVILNTGGVIEISSWRDSADAILLCWQAGQEGGNAIADILSGKVNPSGKLPTTFPISYTDVPAQNFPALNLNTGKNDSFYRFSQEKLYEQENVDFTNYTEGIYVGYRHYLTRHVPVAYPFGYGLSYTTFALSELTTTATETGWEISCKVTNTGQRAGREVVQLYTHDLGTTVARPERELRNYTKTPLLAAGASCTVTMNLTPRDLSYYDETLSAWVTQAGEELVYVAQHADDVGLCRSISVEHTTQYDTHPTPQPDGALYITCEKK
jgi:beta-glucosidase